MLTRLWRGHAPSSEKRPSQPESLLAPAQRSVALSIHPDTLVYSRFARTWPWDSRGRATAHDFIATLVFLKVMHLEVSLMIVAGLLTVIGYSMNDTVIIFDRLREDLHKNRKESLYVTLNRSINETLPRSVITHSLSLSSVLACDFGAALSAVCVVMASDRWYFSSMSWQHQSLLDLQEMAEKTPGGSQSLSPRTSQTSVRQRPQR